MSKLATHKANKHNLDSLKSNTPIAQQYLLAIKHILNSEEQEIVLKDFEKLLITFQDKTILCALENKPINMLQLKKFFDSLFKIYKQDKQDLYYKTEIILTKIAEQGNITELINILDVYISKWHQENSQLFGTLTTAKACNKDLLLTLQDKLTELHNRQVILENVVKPNIIGGAILTINGVIANLSYKTILEQAKTQLLSDLTITLPTI